jgi:hypothetical protein
MDDGAPPPDLRLSVGELRLVEVVSGWAGLADPPGCEASLTIARKRRWFRKGVRFVRSGRGCETDEVPIPVLGNLLTALAYPLVSELDQSLFPTWVPPAAGWYDAVIKTDDYPAHHFRLAFADGREVHIRTESQQPFMLPFWITPPRANFRVMTYDPRLSLALAELLPDGYLEKDRLSGERYRCALGE